MPGEPRDADPGDHTITASDLASTAPTGMADTMAASAAPGGALPPATKVGRFVIAERLGAGGMGEVYAAFDPVLARRVAVKLLHPVRGGATDTLVLRLRREAQAAARLSHRNVVTVYDVGVESLAERGEVFVAMELVEGGTLDDWASSTRRWTEIVEMYVRAGRGLAAAHTAGIVHRDFKPSNVLIGADGEPRVSDFGLASTARDLVEPTEAAAPAALATDDLTRTGAIMGTPIYMAPEQRVAARVDARADQFAFCVALYRAVYRAYPFGDTVEQIVQRQDDDDPIDPRDHHGAPSALLTILRRGLRRDPTARFPAMEALLDALVHLVSRRARRLTIAASVGGMAVVVGSVVFGVSGGSPAAEPCTSAQGSMAAVWNDDARAALTAAFEATGLEIGHDAAVRAATHLDRWSSRWVVAQTGSCRATRIDRTQSERALDLRTTCFDRRRDDLSSLVAYLRAADPGIVIRSGQLALGLPSIESCADVATLDSAAPIDPAGGEARAALARRLGEARLRLDGGEYAEGVPIAAEVLAAARERQDRQLVAEAGELLGKLQYAGGEPKLAKDTLFQAALDAQVTRQYELAVSAWARMIASLQGISAPADEEARIYALGRAALEAGGDLPLAEATLLTDHGNYLALERNDDAAARPLFEHAAELLRKHGAAEHPLMASVLASLGNVVFDLGEHDAGMALQREGLALRERLYGTEHPAVARTVHNLGTSLIALGRFAEAEVVFQRALAIKERTLGPTNQDLSNTLIKYSHLLTTTGRHDQAVDLLRRDRAIWVAAGDGYAGDVAYGDRGIGDVLLAAGRPTDALAAYRQARAGFEAVGEPALALRTRLAAVRPLLELGQLDEAAAEVDAVTAADAAQPAEERTPWVALETARLALVRGRHAVALDLLRELDAADLDAFAASERDLLAAAALLAAGDRDGAVERARRARTACEPQQCREVNGDRFERADALLK